MTSYRYCLIGAYHAGEKRHPRDVVKEIGLAPRHWIPQTISDEIWLVDCQAPDGFGLPKFIEPMQIDGETRKHYGLEP